MKVTVTVYLNIRVGKPNVNAPCYQYLAPGSEIEVDGTLYKGDLYENIDTWYKDEAGNYYWSGGVKLNNIIQIGLNAQDYINSRFDGANLKENIDYNLLFNIEEKFKQKKGENVTIGILDHPISNNLVLKNPIKRPFSQGITSNYHATFISGIMAGLNNINGIASNVNILELPIYDKDGYVLPDDKINSVLDYINSLTSPILLNISQKLPYSLVDKLKKISSNHITIACAGTNSELTGNDLRFPSNMENVIAVGCISKNYLSAKLNKKVDFVIPDFNYVSFDINTNKFISDKGDSYSCAIVSSMAALLISSGAGNYDVKNLKSKIAQLSQNAENTNSINFLNPIIPEI